MAEFDLIDRIAQRCAVVRNDVRLGIGDDAAVVAMPADQELVVCTDTLVAGVHFPMTTAAADIGWKSLAVNLSDLAAMGATPAWALLALTLPEADVDFVAAFAEGFGTLAAIHHVALIGGDTTSGPLSITVTVHGFVPPGMALRREGARAGDGVYVTGTLGDAAAGLRCLANGSSVDADIRALLVARLDRPEPRIAAGAVLRGRASACIDVSDGLVADLGHVARRSGVAIDIEATHLPTSTALLAGFDGESRLALQLGGGDDYELAFTANEADEPALLLDLARAGCAATRIGRVREGSGVRVHDGEGRSITPPRVGWEHFA
jgi:thiamine-monophosphate kinase